MRAWLCRVFHWRQWLVMIFHYKDGSIGTVDFCRICKKWRRAKKES